MPITFHNKLPGLSFTWYQNFTRSGCDTEGMK